MKQDGDEVTVFSSREQNLTGKQKKKKEPLVVVKKASEKKVVPASQASQELFRTKGFWLFDWFPDELIIEEKRLILKRNFFPWGTTVMTLAMDRVTVFELTHSLIFSAIFIKGTYADNFEFTFKWLNHKNAQKAKDLVDGLRLKQNSSVEIMEENKQEFVKTVQVLGHAY